MRAFISRALPKSCGAARMNGCGCLCWGLEVGCHKYFSVRKRQRLAGMSLSRFPRGVLLFIKHCLVQQTGLIFQSCRPHPCHHILVTTAGFAIIQVAHKTSGRQEAKKWRHTPREGGKYFDKAHVYFRCCLAMLIMGSL